MGSKKLAKKVLKKSSKKVSKKVLSKKSKELALEASEIFSVLALANNLIEDLKIPKKHKEMANHVQSECHRIVDLIKQAVGLPTGEEENGFSSEEE